MKIIKLSAKEIAVIQEQLWTNACESKCMAEQFGLKQGKDCSSCEYTAIINNLKERLGE